MAKAENTGREKWFRDFIELIPDVTIIVNESGIIRLVNKQAEELFADRGSPIFRGVGSRYDKRQ